jgi:hypothetical protein
VHVRPVINREVVVHRVNTVVRNVELHRVNTTNKFQEVSGGSQVVHRTVQGETRQVTERREVRGVNCNCVAESGGRGFGAGLGGPQVVSYRD